MDSRRRARELALQALYTMDLIDGWSEDPEDPVLPESAGERAIEFSRRIVRGVFMAREEIDGRIQLFARHWTLPRMNLIERNLLRIAAYELIYCDDIPGKVSINEAMELAKLYGTPETRRFLNGILDRIGREKVGSNQARGKN
jgi:transcription antitermination protein NusB